MIRRCYPKGKNKAFNVTYDDGVLQDVRFVGLLNQYGLKGTFNLNSELMDREFMWVHNNGMEVKRLSRDAVRHLYDGHEIAAHTLTHPYLHDKSDDALMWEIGEDKRRLEALFGREVRGFGVPFLFYDERIARCVQQCGFEYGRMSEESRDYSPWQDPYHWRCGIFHLAPELDAYVDGFFDSREELALCQIVGHSYDLDAENMWDKIERIMRRVAEDDDILPMTHLDIVRYIRAMGQAVIEDHAVHNRSDRELWFFVNGESVAVQSGEKWEER